MLLVPLFALFGNTCNSRPLLLEIAEHSGLTPSEFIESTLCEQFSRLWVQTTLGLGLLPECHAQNVLIALSAQCEPLGYFYYRDFDGLYVDWKLRRARGLFSPPDMPYLWSWYDTYGKPYFARSRYGLIGTQLRVSIDAYVKFVLTELTESMQAWEKKGLTKRSTKTGEFTMKFSHCVFENLRALFPAGRAVPYDIEGQPARFCHYLLTLRRQLFANGAAGPSA